jgi:3-dehydroquinate synthase
LLLEAEQAVVGSDQQGLAYRYLPSLEAVLSSELNLGFPFCSTGKIHTVSDADAVTTIEIRSNQNRYDAIVGSQLLDRAGQLVTGKVRGPRCAIISDANVAPHFADRVVKGLEAASFQPILIAVPAGEKSKSLEQAGEICERMVAARLDRQSFVVGLGGGMIGDLSGFVAAIFQRGIPHVQIPTTLLAMVDSSIGGKTGVNTKTGKNMIGAFHPPALVIDDVDLLRTLPPREFNQGFAEIIKHAVIADAKMFSEVAHASGLRTNELASETLALRDIICRNIEIKSQIIAKDEREQTGERALLNFGHTVGHAIERAGDYEQFRHGEAISLGMVAACAISVKRAGLAKDVRNAIVDLLQKFELPAKLPADFPREKIMEAVKADKKFERGKVRFVVTPAIGSAQLSSDVTLENIREAVEAL